MKSIVLFVAFSCLLAEASAQVMVGDVDINTNKDVKYIEVFFGSKGKGVIAYVDYGQPVTGGGARTILGPDKQQIEFNTNIETLNYLYKNGWEVVTAFVTEGSTTVYLLRRKEA